MPDYIEIILICLGVFLYGAGAYLYGLRVGEALGIESGFQAVQDTLPGWQVKDAPVIGVSTVWNEEDLVAGVLARLPNEPLIPQSSHARQGWRPGFTIYDDLPPKTLTPVEGWWDGILREWYAGLDVKQEPEYGVPLADDPDEFSVCICSTYHPAKRPGRLCPFHGSVKP
jgi:hypothetical protein